MTTPIDPTDVEALGRIAYENNTILPGTIGTPATWDEMERWPEERIPWTSSGLAVASAVCPEHHAVYDTRTHFVVPRDEVPEWACQRCGGYGLISLPCENGFADGPCPDCDGQGVRTSESEVSR
jgi:hypothetical protein